MTKSTRNGQAALETSDEGLKVTYLLKPDAMTSNSNWNVPSHKIPAVGQRFFEMVLAAEAAGKKRPGGQEILEEARPRTSVFHELVFYCPTDEAAEHHYLMRACAVASSIRYIPEGAQQEYELSGANLRACEVWHENVKIALKEAEARRKQEEADLRAAQKKAVEDRHRADEAERKAAAAKKRAQKEQDERRRLIAQQKADAERARAAIEKKKAASAAKVVPVKKAAVAQTKRTVTAAKAEVVKASKNVQAARKDDSAAKKALRTGPRVFPHMGDGYGFRTQGQADRDVVREAERYFRTGLSKFRNVKAAHIVAVLRAIEKNVPIISQANGVAHPAP